MISVIDPNELRRELGLIEPPFALNDFRRYLGVTILTDSGVRSGGVTTWNLDGKITVALPPGTVEKKRETGSHELGHVANGDVGPHAPVLYARGSGRGALLNEAVEQRATNWGIDALIGRGPLGIALRHDEITTVSALAQRFLVNPKFVIQAAVRYGLDHLLLRDPESYAKYLRSAEWSRRSNEILATRRVCERPCCDAPSESVYHLRYDTLGRERSEDVQAMCRACGDEVELRSAFTTGQLVLLPGV